MKKRRTAGLRSVLLRACLSGMLQDELAYVRVKFLPRLTLIDSKGVSALRGYLC